MSRMPVDWRRRALAPLGCATLAASQLALLPASRARDAGHQRPSLKGAAGVASFIVWGRVERFEHLDGRPLATIRVEHVAKGDAPGVLSFFAEPMGDYEPSATIGGYGLFFLEPSGR